MDANNKTVIGKIKAIGAEQIVSAAFKKRELVVTTDEQYPQHIMIEFTQDKCDLLNKYKLGDGVIVGINLRGREWINPKGEAKYFNSIQGWKIEKEAFEMHPSAMNTPMPSAQAFAPATNLNEEEPEDLPF
jgi:hypothetical protein